MLTPADLAPFDPRAMARGRRSAVAFSTESFRNAVVSAVNVVHITAQMFLAVSCYEARCNPRTIRSE
jgi:hypothetical protein